MSLPNDPFNSPIPSLPEEDSDDIDWEDWDGRSPFWAHCLAGSLAGVVEHAAIFPLDTVRTHIQVCAACLKRGTTAIPDVKSGSIFNAKLSSLEGSGSSLLHGSGATASPHRLPLGMFQTIRYLVNEPVVSAASFTEAASLSSSAHSMSASASTTTLQHPTVVAGWTRLFRGIQAVMVGCVPAHALYFSSYEIVKAAFMKEDGRASTVGSSLAGAAAVTAHDLVMTPLDTVKQRLQIGHYRNARHAAYSIFQSEGIVALYRSFPITLVSNIPYGMIMVTTHEACKQLLRDYSQLQEVPVPQWQIVLTASSVAGCIASALTTPLDRIKTALQTQQLEPLCGRRLRDCPLKKARGDAAITTTIKPKHLNWHQAARTIWVEEGLAGFWRGLAPRILSHTPAVAISWTTYETAKQYILSSTSLYHHH
jgi:solute carrier family 25 (mitochondrial iron transporter), member 28/37